MRLLLEIKEILSWGELTLDANAEMLREIQAGEWSLEKIRQYFDSWLPFLEGLYERSGLPETPRKEAIRLLLLRCLEMYYGSLSNIFGKSIDYPLFLV